MKIHVRKPKTKEEIEQYWKVRWEILRKPLNIPLTKPSEPDDKIIKVIAINGKEVIGTGGVHFNSKDEAQIRHMAVKEEFRKKGVGSLIIKELEKIAKEGGAKQIILNARETALSFYQKNGYLIIENPDIYFEGILHKKMKKEIRL